MKQTIKILTALLVALIMSSGGAWAQTFSGGSGISTDPYQIKTIDDMTALATAVNGGTDYSGTYFKLMNDITYSSTDAFTVVGSDGHSFAGKFDGNGKTVKGIRYTYTGDETAYIGLFGKTLDADIKDLTLDDCWFQKTGTSDGNIAVVVGYGSGTPIDKVIVKNCKAIARKGYAAGIMSYAYYGVTNCVVENTEISVIDGSTLNGLAGGIVAYENGGSASNNVVANCTIQACHAGGICGDAFSGSIESNHVENCTITGKESAAGISTVAGVSTHGCSHSGNTVAGATTITVPADGKAGALFAERTGTYTWKNNYYAEEVKVIIGSTTYDGTTARGYYFVGSPSTAPSSPDDYWDLDGAKGGTFYQVKLVASPATFGTVSATRQWCLSGKSMTSTVTATPNAGFNFLGWTSTDVTLTDASASTTTFTKALTSAVTITANFGAGLSLKNNLTNATVTFYDYGTTAPTKESFSTSAPGTETNSIESGNYVVAHIVPADDYWTDEKLLMSMEAGTLSPARRRDIGLDLGRKLTLLKVDEYDPGDGVMVPRHDGAGWYYYQIPSAHTMAAGYTSSVIEGYSPKKFVLSDDDASDGAVVEQNGKTITVPNGEGWTAEIILNQVSFPFNGEDQKPTITGITVKMGSDELVTLTSGFDGQLAVFGTKRIGTFPKSGTTERLFDAKQYCWFGGSNTNPDIVFDITIPLTVADNTAPKGAANNPWLITSTAEMNLFAKCVNVGEYSFKDENVKLTTNLTYDATTNADFQPVGRNGLAFLGSFDGGNNTISAIDYNNSHGLGEVGLFGFVGEYPITAIIKDITLSDCKFKGGSNALVDYSGGALAGIVLGGVTVSNVTVTNCEVTGAEKVGAPKVGGIIGDLSKNSKITGCTISGTTITNKVTDDGGMTAGFCRTGGIVGYLHQSEISNCIAADCTISSEHNGTENPGNIIGGIVGDLPYSPTLKNNLVKGSTTIADKINTAAINKTGAIYGVKSVGGDMGTTVIANNYYEKSVTVSHRNSGMTEAAVVSGYTPRGVRTIEGFSDVTTDDGAMMYVKPATISGTTSANGSTVSFDKKTPGTDCYSKNSDGTTIEYAPGENVTLAVDLKTRKETDDIRTFSDELTALTMNDGTTDTDIKEAQKFTMPDANATVSATISESKWFTIQSNEKQWMTFYHEWKDATGALANYTVSDGSGTGKTVKAKTVESFNLITGAVTPVDLSNVSYYGVPTLFHCEPLKDPKTNTLTTLPALLKFTPVADKTAPNYDYRIKGVTTDTYLTGSLIFVMNGLGDFISAYDKSEPLKAHRCYIDLSATPTNATRLYIVVDGEETGISDNKREPITNNNWYSLDGRKLDGRPTRGGVYINNGMKVVIK